MISDAAAAAAMMAAAAAPAAASSGWPWPTPATCPGATSPAPARTGSSPPGNTVTWRKPPAPAAGGTREKPGKKAGSPIAAMAARLATEDGIAAYRRRSHLGETFHGDIKHNQGLRRLSVRGLPRASGEWAFATAVRNLRKAITSGHLTAQSLAALPG